MSDLGDRVAHEAEQLIGAPFRLQGRNPETGLDCVGLALCALEAAGVRSHPPTGYSLRNTSIERYLLCAHHSGLRSATGVVTRGDVLLVRPGPAQHHLLIALGLETFVHAHAGLRQVVEQHGLSDWPIIKHWRFAAP